MPEVVGASKAAVFAAMSRAGLYFRTVGPGNWNVAVGESPAAGAVVPWHSTVVVRTAVRTATPSSAATTMPDVLYRTRSETYAAMRRANLYFRTVGPANWNIVTGQNPRPGTALAARSTVTVVTAVVRTSSPTGTTRMPKVLHDTRSTAYVALARAGLYFVTHGPANWRYVTAQNPRPGTVVAWHSTVVLATALALPAPRPRPRPTRAPTTTTRVPSVVGMPRVAALAALARAGLRVHLQGPGATDGTWTRATAQNLVAGSVVRRGTVIVVDTTRPATPPTTTTTTPPPTTTTTLPGSPGGSTTTAPPSTTTTTTTPPPTTTTTVAPARERIGIATWYSYIPGQCATSYLPKGTRITVTDLASGRSIQCVVTDRQAYSPGRVVDLSETQFSELAPLWQGVVKVRVTW